MTTSDDQPRMCACGKPADGSLLPVDPNDPASPLIATDHQQCNRGRLFAMLGAAAAESTDRLARKASTL